ncbi:MAG: hypothetical protein WCY09_07025 [Candidatus Omnitrophota bacterium]
MDSKIAKFVQLGKINLAGKNIIKFLVEDISYHRLLLPKDIITIEEIGGNGIKQGDFIFGYNVASQQGVFQVIEKRIEKNELIFILREEYKFYFDGKMHSDQLIGRLISINRGQGDIKVNTFEFFLKNKIELGLILLKRKVIKIIKSIQLSIIFSRFVKMFHFKTKFIYRIANINDVENIARLLRWHYWPMSLRDIRKRIYSLFTEAEGKQYCFIACRNNAIAGIIITKEKYSNDTHNPFWYLDMLYIGFFYRYLGLSAEFSLFVLCYGVRKNITEFIGVSTKGIRPYSENLFKKINLDKVGSVTISEESNPASSKFFHKRLSYTIKITQRDKLLKYQLPGLR